MSKVYLAGKITGNPDYKEQFNEAEQELIARGNTVMNPSFLPEGFDQKDYHHICMAMIDVCDTVCFLSNWIDSKGSHLEYGYAMGKSKRIEFYGPF
jgi:nucleoside 2-deoxyribosyltransferase